MPSAPPINFGGRFYKTFCLRAAAHKKPGPSDTEFSWSLAALPAPPSPFGPLRYRQHAHQS